jgi:hypothetical protein
MGRKAAGPGLGGGAQQHPQPGPSRMLAQPLPQDGGNSPDAPSCDELEISSLSGAEEEAEGAAQAAVEQPQNSGAASSAGDGGGGLSRPAPGVPDPPAKRARGRPRKHP